MFNTPILLVVFNRPDTTLKVLKVIQTIKPKVLYVAADGPRINKPEDSALCKQTRKIVKSSIDWDCELKLLFRENNVGCGKAVSGAISWFFKNESEGIILEDDCLPEITFFRYSEELLKKYRFSQSIMQICGSNLQMNNKRGCYSYYFSKIPQVWGWATWKDRWEKFRFGYDYLEEFKIKQLYKTPNKQKFWVNLYENAIKNNMDIWGYQWTLTIQSNDGIVIIPNENLISNIGFGEQAAHTKDKTNKRANIPVKPLKFPIRHPKKIHVNNKADQYIYENYLLGRSVKKIRLLKRIKKILIRILRWEI